MVWTKPWGITPEQTDRVLQCGRFGTFSRHRSTRLWWAKDTAGHGGVVWKVFQQVGHEFRWLFDADVYGDRIEGKHKGPLGKTVSLETCHG